MPPGKQNPSPSAQEIAETLYRETMADCRDVWSMSDETLKRIHGRMASAITAAVAAAEREDTKMLDWLENPLNQLHMFGNFLQGGSPTELRNQIRLAMNSSASSSVLPAMETFCKRFGPMTINVGYGRDIEIYKRTQEKLFLAWCAGKESVLPATKATEERGDFWKRMFERAKCGCIQADCRQHGSWTPADIERIEFDPSVSPGNENQSADQVAENKNLSPLIVNSPSAPAPPTEDVTGEEPWVFVEHKLETNAGYIQSQGRDIFPERISKRYGRSIVDAHNSSVSRLQERVRRVEVAQFASELAFKELEQRERAEYIEVQEYLSERVLLQERVKLLEQLNIDALVKSLLARAETAEKNRDYWRSEWNAQTKDRDALLSRAETAEAALRKTRDALTKFSEMVDLLRVTCGDVKSWREAGELISDYEYCPNCKGILTDYEFRHQATCWHCNEPLEASSVGRVDNQGAAPLSSEPSSLAAATPAQKEGE